MFYYWTLSIRVNFAKIEHLFQYRLMLKLVMNVLCHNSFVVRLNDCLLTNCYIALFDYFEDVFEVLFKQTRI